MANKLKYLAVSKKKVKVDDGLYCGFLESDTCMLVDQRGKQIYFKVEQGIRGSCSVDVVIKKGIARLLEAIDDDDDDTTEGGQVNWLFVFAVAFIAIAAYHIFSK
jgi:hypothetical protein